MNNKRSAAQTMAILIFSGALLLPIVTKANNTAGFGSNHYSSGSAQMYNNLDLSHIGMDGGNMAGFTGHFNDGRGSMRERRGNAPMNFSGDYGTYGGHAWGTHHEYMNSYSSPRFSGYGGHHYQSPGYGSHSGGHMMGGMH